MDWKKIITDLKEAGITQKAIGKQVGLAQPSISDILRGKTKDVRWAAGDALLAMHRNICRKSARRVERTMTNKGKA